MNIADYWNRETNKNTVKAEIRAVEVQGSNPCMLWWGPGPVGATCGKCAHRRAIQYSKKYWKCDQREDLTHGAKTDQKASWPACARYAPIQEEDKS